MTMLHVDPTELKALELSLADLAREARVPYLRLWRAANGGERFNATELERITSVLNERRRGACDVARNESA